VNFIKELLLTPSPSSQAVTQAQSLDNLEVHHFDPASSSNLCLGTTEAMQVIIIANNTQLSNLKASGSR
jgi:hypothetical protein